MSALDDDKQTVIMDAAAHAFRVIGDAVSEAMCRPSVLYRPSLSMDGNQWCALYGNNLQDGVAGFGDTPYAAMQHFDNVFYKKGMSKSRIAPAETEMPGVSKDTIAEAHKQEQDRHYTQLRELQGSCQKAKENEEKLHHETMKRLKEQCEITGHRDDGGMFFGTCEHCGTEM